MIESDLNKKVKKAVSSFIEKNSNNLDFNEEINPGLNFSKIPEHGHYSTAVALHLSQHHRAKGALEIAQDIKYELEENDPFFEKIEIAAPGFINFWLSPKTIQDELKFIVKKGAKWGIPQKKNKETVVMDYSAPNIAKPMSIGHLRSTIIGQALCNIFRFSGYKVISDNHLGDWGKQFGVLIAAYKEEARDKKIKLAINDLMRLYVDYTARMKSNPALEDVAREEARKLQRGDKENTRIWKEFYKISLAEFSKVYKTLDVKFDKQLSESFYNPMLKGIVEKALKSGVAVKSEGAVIIPFENESPLIIQKSDGAYLYATTDLAAIEYRVKKLKPVLILYVVGNEQSLHFKQLFRAAEILGIAEEKIFAHVKFGLILSSDMKRLSTREGRHISLIEVIDEAVSRAKKIIEEKRPDLSSKEKEKIAKAVGIGALIYNDLSQNRQSDIAFDWDKMINFEGNSGPYLQYTHARLKSILSKSRTGLWNPKHLVEEKELELIRKIDEFPFVVERVAGNYFPHYLAEYLYELAKSANSFYQEFPVLKAPKNIRNARLALIGAVARTLKTGLGLLNIEAVEKI